MRAAVFLQPTRIAGLVLMTMLLLGAAAAVSPDAVRASLDVPLTDGCTQTTGGWACPLTVTVQGSGTVASSDGLINCGNDCQETYFYNLETPKSVSLTATAAQGWRFSSWGNSPCASASGSTCRVEMDHARYVTAIFESTTYRLTVTLAGSGSGNVKGAGIDCPGDCAEDVAAGTTVELTATPNVESTWFGWGGDAQNCGTATTCSVAMTADRSVTATFNAPVAVKRTLKVSVTGTGKVTATGIDCPTDCEEQYDSGASVQLTATPGSGMTLTSWGGDCGGTATTCSLTMNSDKTVSATFAAAGGGGGSQEHTLTVTVNGSGRVSGTGINCPGDCTQQYPAGTQVTLNATPDPKFDHTWGGDCAAAGVAASCSLAMTVARSAVATFKPTATVQGAEIIDGGHSDPGVAQPKADYRTAIFQVNGAGILKEGSAPERQTAGASATRPINCGTTGSGTLRFDCYGEYRPGEALTVTAKPAPGYAFKRWTGACAGSKATCRVVTKDARTVTAVFEATGRGAAVAATLRPPRLRVRWQSSVGAGNLVVEGSTSLPAAARVDVRRPGGGPLATLKLKLQGGKFRQTLPLRRGALSGGAKLFPGGFTVALTGRSGGLKLPLQMQTIAISSPAEGVVRKAFRSASENGREVVRFPAGATVAWANFRFETQPRMNQRLTVRWYWPDGKQLGEVRKNNRPVISSYLRLATGLPSGLWVAELRAGKRVVHRLSIRIG